MSIETNARPVTAPDVAPAAAAHPRFRPDIQGLRALAVVLVVANHLVGWPGGGFVGVDVFFVISGFLITGLLATGLERTGRVDLREFYARRARRILPMAVVVLVATVAAAFALLAPQRAHETLVGAVYSLLFVENWHLVATGTDYWHLGEAASPVQQYWSLSVEEQFYLLWPLLLLAMWALGARLRGHGGQLAGDGAEPRGLAALGRPRGLAVAGRQRGLAVAGRQRGLAVAGLGALVAALFAWACLRTAESPDWSCQPPRAGARGLRVGRGRQRAGHRLAAAAGPGWVAAPGAHEHRTRAHCAARQYRA